MPEVFKVAMLLVCFQGDCTHFEKDSPEDIKITYAGCDITQRRPETDNDWRIIPNADPEHIIPDKNDLRWQQEKGQDL